MRSAVSVCTCGRGRDVKRKTCGRGAYAQVEHAGTVEHGRIIETDGARHAVAELSSVLDVVDAGDVVSAAHQERVVVARITIPRRSVGRSRLTEGETSELDEHHFDRHVTAAGDVERVGSATRECGERVRVRTSEVVELEVTLAEGTDNAVFGGSASINRQRHTGAGREVIAVAVTLTEVARIGRLTVSTTVERGVDANVATQLDAGIGARDVVETRAIQGADPHVLDRFGLDGKIGSLCPAHGDQTRR